MIPRPFFFLLAAALLLPTADSDLAADRAALVALRTAVGGRSRLWNLSSDSPCNWVGVSCAGNRVVELRLPGMGLSGELPIGLGNLTQLITLSLRFNALRGSVPDDVSNLRSLRNLFLHGNLFTGEIPGVLFRMQSLVRINLADNRFTGSISPDFNNLTRLATMYLEGNQLTGPIPNINVPPLDQFNVSFNNLSGQIPDSLSGKPAASFEGNSLLCGRPLVVCRDRRRKFSGGEVAGITIGCMFGVLLILIIVFFLCRRKEESSETEEFGNKAVEKQGMSSESGKNLVFFGETPRGFNLEDLLRASAEVLGKGTFGTTYKATLDMGFVTAVKRLKEVIVGEKEYREKIEGIGKMGNHESLVPLKAYYYSRDEKLLVYEFMPMGSLSALLHGNRGGAGRNPLNWDTRSTIALKAARGIAYLHSQGPSISHGNIKSSNILLTKSYEPRISDFGLNQVAAGPAAPNPNRTEGYRAPEVTDGHKVSQKADVYSFGVLLLELLTGKAANAEGDVDLPQWVRSVVKEEWSSKVFDLELMRYQNVEEEMVKMLQVAVDCTGQVPDTRPSMAEVCGRVEEICRLNGGGDHSQDGGGIVVDYTSGQEQSWSVDSGAPAPQSS